MSISSRVEREPDDVRDRQRCRNGQDRSENEPSAADDRDRGEHAAEPLPIVANVGDAGSLAESRAERVDRGLRGRVGSQTHFV